MSFKLVSFFTFIQQNNNQCGANSHSADRLQPLVDSIPTWSGRASPLSDSIIQQQYINRIKTVSVVRPSSNDRRRTDCDLHGRYGRLGGRLNCTSFFESESGATASASQRSKYKHCFVYAIRYRRFDSVETPYLPGFDGVADYSADQFDDRCTVDGQTAQYVPPTNQSIQYGNVMSVRCRTINCWWT